MQLDHAGAPLVLGFQLDERGIQIDGIEVIFRFRSRNPRQRGPHAIGAATLVAGTSVFQSADYAGNIARLRG